MVLVTVIPKHVLVYDMYTVLDRNIDMLPIVVCVD